MQRRTCLALMIAAGALVRPAAAAVMESGVAFQERIQLAGAELQLNGTGVRAVAWIRGYAAGLYLAGRARTADEVVAMPGPKRLRMVMLMGAPASEFVKAFDKGVTRNVGEAEAEALRARMAQFDAMLERIGEVNKGDVVDMDYEPGRGMTLTFNGSVRGAPIPGADFYGGLLLSFVGARPYDKRLRAGLLGGEP
ncbi:MAG TPA: chalcone isomerase family protein [Rubrivivax sp.]|nr:chalcone isomerase family protein [Rubrivivax sp.]